jgi:hypothetical protein
VGPAFERAHIAVRVGWKMGVRTCVAPLLGPLDVDRSRSSQVEEVNLVGVDSGSDIGRSCWGHYTVD